MNIDQKKQAVAALKETIGEGHVYVVDTHGMKVQEVNQIRKKCREKGVKFEVVKNTLLKRALDEIYQDPQRIQPFAQNVIKGSSSIFVVEEVANMPAKILQEITKKGKKEKPRFKGALVYQEAFIGADQLKTLSELKSKEELIAEVIALLQSPIKQVVSALQSGGNTLASLVEALSKK